MSLNDPMINFLTLTSRIITLRGHAGRPPINRENCIETFGKMEKSFNEFYSDDLWEKFFCEGWYYHIIASFEILINNNLDYGIKFQEKSKQSWLKVPNDGLYLSNGWGSIALGFYLRLIGRLNDSNLELLKVINTIEKFNNSWELLAFINLTGLYIQLGNLEAAQEINSKSLLKVKNLDNLWLKFNTLSDKGYILRLQGKYEESQEAYLKSLDLRRVFNDPRILFNGFYDIFDLYIYQFSITQDEQYFMLAESFLSEMKKLKQLNQDNITIVNFCDFAEARILKNGNIKKRIQSFYILENLTKMYPHDLKIILELMELQFQEAKVSSDKDIIENIESLIDRFSKISYLDKSESVGKFILQQKILSKYNLIIKSDINEAIRLLQEAKNRVHSLNYQFLEREIDTELEKLYSELKKWEKTDFSIRERIKNSEFSEYIKDVMKFNIIEFD
jgi:tetratricopeptide (TPR) repeat protein